MTQYAKMNLDRVSTAFSLDWKAILATSYPARAKTNIVFTSSGCFCLLISFAKGDVVIKNKFKCAWYDLFIPNENCLRPTERPA